MYEVINSAAKMAKEKSIKEKQGLVRIP